MRQLKKIFLVPAAIVLISSCGASTSSNMGTMPDYPPAPAPPFRSELKPTQLYSNAEADFTCLLNEKNPSDIKCWGDNSRGQVSSNGQSSPVAPITIVAGIPKVIIDPSNGQPVVNPDTQQPYALLPSHVSVGKSHACVALNDYSIWCWGDNSKGQLSSSLDTALVHPVTRIGEGELPDTAVNALAAGNEHTCAALSDENNSIWCWGDNSDGQVSGDGKTDGHKYDDGSVSQSLGFTNVTEHSHLPKTPDDVVVLLSAGHNFTCAVYEHRASLPIEAQSVWCWGNNSAEQVTGEINNSSKTSDTSFAVQATQVVGLPTGKITNLTAGYSHACVSLADGNIWCWGNDQNAQVSGVKHTTSVSPGLTLVGGVPNKTDKVLAMSAGANFTCANFTNRDLWCWGDNQNGAIDGAGLQGSFAQRITKLSAISESVVLSAGAHHMCAAFTEGEVKCWGDDSKGQVNGKGAHGKPFERITQLTL